MKSIIRTEQIQINSSQIVSTLCHCSKNLWNQANYIIRQEFFEHGKWIRYNELDKEFKTYDNYRVMNAQSAQQTLKMIDRSWRSYFKAIKEWKKNPDKFLGMPRPPNYKPKNGEATIIFTNQQCKIKEGYLIFPKNLQINSIKTRLNDNINLREVRIIPKGTGYTCEIVYKKDNRENIINNRWYAKRNRNRIIGIDYGISNIVTIGNNIGIVPIVIEDNGKGIKSINQFYNKKKAELQSIYDKQGIKFGTKMSQLNSKRNMKMKDTMHKTSRFIINYCIEHDIETIVIGKNDNWKQNVNLGTITNQNFVQIPYNQLTQMVKYKAKEISIDVKTHEESYTSKCSFLDNEPIMHHDTYAGVRIKRGLFKSANGTIINADVQGACNIIRKCEPKAYADGVGGCMLHPIRLNPLIGGIL